MHLFLWLLLSFIISASGDMGVATSAPIITPFPCLCNIRRTHLPIWMDRDARATGSANSPLFGSGKVVDMSLFGAVSSCYY